MPLTALSGVIVTFSGPASALSGMVSVKTEPSAPVAVSEPPKTGIIAVAAFAPSSVTDTLFGCGVGTVALAPAPLPLDPPAHPDAIVADARSVATLPAPPALGT